MEERDKAIIGKKGEDLAVAHLRKQGYKLIERNYRRRFGEIDIIARDGEVLVFIEVKTRQTLSHGSPSEAVAWRKQTQISKGALDYLQRNNLFDQPARFDVVAVMLAKEQHPHIEIIKNAFEFCE